METTAHNQLKKLSVTFLRHWGCHAVSTEVRCPIARYRVDVAGWLDRAPVVGGEQPIEEVIAKPRAAAGEKRVARTVMIECKQVRSDYLRDGKETEKLLHRREQLTRIRKSIEENRVKLLEPHLCQTGTALFSEFDEWDFSSSKLTSYHSVCQALERVDEALHGQTKFSIVARYHLADYLYIAAPQGMIRPRELPPGWGLLECPEIWLAADGASLFDGPQLFEVRVPAPLHESKQKWKLRLLRNIAVSASYKALPE
jgi:hypothetical protein